MLSKVPAFIWMTAGLAVLFIVAAVIDSTPPEDPTEEPASVRLTPFESDFMLVDHRGVAVRSRELAGAPTLVFFGFTYCPDICPTTLYDLSTLLDELGDDANRLQVLFITVDPERDTVDNMETYLSLFHPAIRGLTGPQDQIDAAARAFFAHHEKTPVEGGDYLMTHNASVYLIGADGAFRETLADDDSEPAKLEKIRRLLVEADTLS